MNFETRINKLIKLINQRITSYLPTDFEPLFDAMCYATDGGKKVRPLIMLLCCETLGGDIEYALPFACAIEMIHAYSLVHDDLPAMDDDDFRRGRPTCHKVFGQGLAILTGDGLLNRAFEVMAEAADSPDSLMAMKSIIAASGKMVIGQGADIVYENKTIDKDTLLFIHRNKTGAIITACFEAGAYLAGKSDKAPLMKELGEMVGLGFQIKDDILDADENENSSFVRLYGLQGAKAEYENLSNEIKNTMSGIGANSALGLYIEKLLNRSN